MSVIGKVKSVWRYPVKSMRGEELAAIYLSYAGVYGDRLFAFQSSAAPKGFPFFTGREQPQLLRYRPRYRQSERAAQPVNLESARKLSPNINPLPASAPELMIDVETPNGETFAIDDPALIEHLCRNLKEKPRLKLLRSDKAMTDCRPISLFSVQTAHRIGEEAAREADFRRFRANIYLDLTGTSGFAEDQLVGKSIRLGERATVAVLQRDGRCAMITLDPDTAAKEPAILKTVARAHEGMAGVYGAVLVEGMVRPGDLVSVMS